MSDAYTWVKPGPSVIRTIIRRDLTLEYRDQPFFMGMDHPDGRLGVPLFYGPEKDGLEGEGLPADLGQPCFEPYDYQEEAISALLANRTGILKSATGSGKTFMALVAAQRLGQRTLVIVHSKTLFEQWIGAAKKGLGLEDSDIGVIQGPISRWKWEKPLVIGMLQTLARYVGSEPEGMRESFGAVIYDEVHHMQAQWFSNGVYYSTRRRWGLSATPFTGNILDKGIRWNFGPILFEHAELPVSPNIEFHWMQLPSWVKTDDHGEPSSGYNYGLRMALSKTRERVQKAAELTIRLYNENRHVMTMSPTVKGLYAIRHEIERQDPGVATQINILTGRIAQRSRAALLDSPILLATQNAAISSEGLDRPQTDGVVVVGSVLGHRPFHQILGRAARPYTDKTDATVCFLCDDVPSSRGALNVRAREAKEKGLEITWDV